MIRKTTTVVNHSGDREDEFTFVWQADEDYGRVEVGVTDPDNPGRVAFGMSAEVYVDSKVVDWNADRADRVYRVVAQVSQAAIGSHDPDIARLRIRAYEFATRIAEQINVHDGDIESAVEVSSKNWNG